MGQTSKACLCIKIGWFFILPLVPIWLLFWHNIAIPITYERTVEGKIQITLAANELSRPGLRNTVRKIFQTPFDLTFYNFCFDNRSRVDHSGTSDPIGTAITLETPSGNFLAKVPIGANGKGCVSVDAKEFLISTVTANIPGKILYILATEPTELHGDVVPEDPATPTNHDKWASSVLFLLAFWGLTMLLVSVWEFLKGRRI